MLIVIDQNDEFTTPTDAETREWFENVFSERLCQDVDPVIITSRVHEEDVKP